MAKTMRNNAARGSVSSTSLRGSQGKARTELEAAGQHLHGWLRGISWAVPPKVTVVDGQVTWPCEYPKPIRRVRDPESDFLSTFLDLAYCDDEDLDREVAGFARQWGPLWICERHGLPSSHTRPPGVGAVQVWIEGRKLGDCPPARTDDGTRWTEPVEAWQQLARQARALVLARADLLRAGRVSRERREELNARMSLGGIDGLPAEAEWAAEGTYVEVPQRAGLATEHFFIPEVTTSASSILGRSMQWWLDQGAIRPTIRSRPNDFGMELRADSLFGAIGLRLAGSLASARPLVPCDYCGTLYVQTREGTYFCGSDDCNKARLRRNTARRARGEARRYKPRNPDTEG